MRPISLLLAALLIPTIGCVAARQESGYRKLDLRTGGTPEQVLQACRAAGVEAQFSAGSGQIASYRESFHLSDGRLLLLIVNHEVRPPRVTSLQIKEPDPMRR